MAALVKSTVKLGTSAGVVATGVAIAPAVILNGAMAGTGGAAAVTSGLVAFGPAGMAGGISTLGLLGGLFGTLALYPLVCQESAKVQTSVLMAGGLGACAAAGVSLAVVMAAAAPGLGGAAVLTSGLCAIGGTMLGGIAVCSGIGAGVALAFGLLVLLYWWYNGELGKTGAESDELFRGVGELSVNEIPGTFISVGVPSHEQRIVHIVTPVLDWAAAQPAPPPLDHSGAALLELGSLAVLPEIKRQLDQIDADVPWYLFWKCRGGENIRRVVRLLATVLLISCTCPTSRCILQGVFAEACDKTLSQEGKRALEAMYFKMLLDFLRFARVKVLDVIRAQETQFASQFFGLDLDSQATQQQIEQTYKALARKYHPDKVRLESPEKQELAEGLAQDLMRYINFAKEWLGQPRAASASQEPAEPLALSGAASTEQPPVAESPEDASSIDDLFNRLHGTCVRLEQVRAAAGVQQARITELQKEREQFDDLVSA